jgi:hypothetical protein
MSEKCGVWHVECGGAARGNPSGFHAAGIGRRKAAGEMGRGRHPFPFRPGEAGIGSCTFAASPRGGTEHREDHAGDAEAGDARGPLQKTPHREYSDSCQVVIQIVVGRNNFWPISKVMHVWCCCVSYHLCSHCSGSRRCRRENEDSSAQY